MPYRDPHNVLGVAADASAATIKAAWRRLARENHPDLTAGDAGAARAATRRMAEINAAYEELRVPRPAGARRAGASEARRGAAAASGGGRGPAGGPRADAGNGSTPHGAAGADAATPPPGAARRRPVTARLDTTGTFRPRNQTTTRPRAAGPLWHPVRPPNRPAGVEREPLRASDPTGPPRRARLKAFRPPKPPCLDEALAHPVAFGKFHGHTLGEIAAFEPSYIDWLASTITRDRELVAAARVIRDDLDARGITRRRRPTRPQPQPDD